MFAVLAWLFWILVIAMAAVLLMWAFLTAVVVIGGIASTALCPRCGLPFEITDRDGLLYELPRYDVGGYDRCSRCGWRRSDDGRV